MKKQIAALVAVALVTSAAFAQQPAAPAQPASSDPIIIAAGDLTIRQSEFEKALESLPAEYQQFALGPGKKQFAEDFLRMRMLAIAGTKNGLDKDPEVVSQMKLMLENLVANAQLEKMRAEIAISDADLQKKYDAKKAEYEQVKARHILVAFKGSPAANPEKPELTEEQAKAKAEDIRKQLVAGGSFEEIAKKESDDLGSGARGGDLGEFGRGQMVPEFEKAAFEAKVGEITPIVRTQFGYHIIKVDEHASRAFAEVKGELEQVERQERLKAQLEKMKENAKPTFNDAYFGAPVAAPATPATPAEPK